MNNIDLRKLFRYVINFGALFVAILTLPAFGAVVPEAWIPSIASVVAIVNTILSFIRQIGAGEPFVTKTL